MAKQVFLEKIVHYLADHSELLYSGVKLFNHLRVDYKQPINVHHFYASLYSQIVSHNDMHFKLPFVSGDTEDALNALYNKEFANVHQVLYSFLFYAVLTLSSPILLRLLTKKLVTYFRNKQLAIESAKRRSMIEKSQKGKEKKRGLHCRKKQRSRNKKYLKHRWT